jgi:uncharacterized membrane protein YkvA (DUF1232 family)
MDSSRLLNELIGSEGFTHLTVDKLFRPGPLLDVLTEKTNSLNGRSFSEQELEREVRPLIDLLRETLSRRYTRLSILAFAHILVALDYFVRVKDAKPDTYVGGYADDLAFLKRTSDEFREEIDDFKAWQKQMERF